MSLEQIAFWKGLHNNTDLWAGKNGLGIQRDSHQSLLSGREWLSWISASKSGIWVTDSLP